MSEAQPRIWLLLGERAGDNNQLLALAEALGLPFETRTLRYNLLRLLRGRFGTARVSTTRRSRRFLHPPWPDLVLGIGWRSVAVALHIRKASGGRTRLVRLGNPRWDPAKFDLVISTAQYPVAPAPNVLRLPLALSRYRTPPEPDESEKAWVAELPRPLRLMAVGGPTKFWTVAQDSIVAAARQIAGRGGSLVTVTSARTPASVKEALRSELAGRPECRLIEGGQPRFPILLAQADEIFVTGDSVSMLSEAVLTGKPVGMIPIEMTAAGRRKLGAEAGDGDLRDLRRFWAELEARGLVGTLDQPKSSRIEDPALTAAAAVRKLLLGDGLE